MEENIQHPQIMLVPGLVLPEVVDDDAVAAYPVQVDFFVFTVCIVPGQHPVTEVVFQGVNHCHFVSIQGGQNILIRQQKKMTASNRVIPMINSPMVNTSSRELQKELTW